ncbi:DUF4118 domain-containing protein [Dactylosporangium aurantiacum]|uniref:histidine kinase n=1 Tax=Dactylosporangium aurantiacum TaxID=35754 RepID=A0A9Q9IRR8_9ACTN|nr:DUF4118 domain-containing protein [Dactylosporangium aurantiacum]MDG6106301.1 DUF4118 domain-containing protein [Dactylosporangium aurantiacum]UWZ58204.1 DUF4118 domain-containing protein [Dactylosporangium aurantiacum]
MAAEQGSPRMAAIRHAPLSWLVRPVRPPWATGIAVALLLITLETVAVAPFRGVMTSFSPAMVYIIGVLVISAVWGRWLGMFTALASTAAFAVSHGLTVGRFTASDVQDLAGLAVFLAVVLATSALADLSRARTVEAEESDLTAAMAQLLLHTDDVATVLPAVARCIAQSLQLPEAEIHLAAVAGDDRRTALPLSAGADRIGTLLVPATVPGRTMGRLRERVVPSLASLLHAGWERTAVLHSLESSRKRLGRLAAEQAALGRVATLVARGGRPAEVFDAITTELHGLLSDFSTWLLRYEPDGTVTILSTSMPGLQPGQTRWPLRGENIPLRVRETGRPARMDSFQLAAGDGAELAREFGIRSAVGLPIVVEGRLWGLASVASTRPEPLPADTEARVAGFVRLAATAVANADSREELAASRARLVVAADQTRERIERRLHDGALQHFLAVAMRLGATQAGLPPDQQETKAELSRALDGLNRAVDDLREICQGIHPTLLAAGGLPPALKALARRSPVPVDLDLHTDERLPSVVEVAAYHMVSEALTNAGRHARASLVHVRTATQDGALHLSVSDDGAGGADPHRGTGLIALQDRVEALGGQLTVTSPTGGGTLLTATIPTTVAT